jgi:hypothetical protein
LPRAAATLGTIVLGAFACTSSPSAPDLPPLEDRGDVRVQVDLGQRLGPIVTGGGTNFTGFAKYVAPESARTDDLAKIPYRLNRVHFSGEVPDEETWRTEDRLDEHYPQPKPPPEPWDFQWLDGVVKVVEDVKKNGGPDYIMTIHNAPQWMTTDFQMVGHLPRNFDDYAKYCARIVSYYNRGSFVDDAGRTVTSPFGPLGIKYWEIWNEPDINDVGGGDVAVMTPDEYARLFATVAPAMRAVDPSIKIGGPNTVADYEDTLSYVHALLGTGATVDFLAMHQYQAGPGMPDGESFRATAAIVNRPTTTLPIVISESNSDANDDQRRTGGPFEWAAMPLMYEAHVVAGTWRVLRWETYESAYDLVDAARGKLVTTYWAEQIFWSAVPEGATRVACTTSSPDVDCLATVSTAGKLKIAVINRGVAHEADFDGDGVAHAVTIAAPGKADFAIRVVDRHTPPNGGPATTHGTTLVLDGYGVAAAEEP